MPNVHCQVVMPFRSGLPQDVSVNTFTFGAGTGTALALAEAAYPRLVDFYTTQPSGASATVASFLGAWVDRPNAYIKFYDLADAKPRRPIKIGGLDLGSNINTHDLPHEVSVCISFQGWPESGMSQARRRGRIFIGPLRFSAKTNDDNVPPRPTSVLLDTFKRAAHDLAEANDGSGNWVVWSRTGNSFTEVTNGWVDDEFDTQRRRQPASTSRNGWQVT